MIMHRGDQTLAIRALKSAAPYIRMYKGKTFVVKTGGGVFAEAESTRTLVEQIGILHYFGVRVVLVHGGGPQLTELAAALGLPARVVDGRRVTDEKSIELTAMVLNGLINTRVLGICRALGSLRRDRCAQSTMNARIASASAACRTSPKPAMPASFRSPPRTIALKLS